MNTTSKKGMVINKILFLAFLIFFEAIMLYSPMTVLYEELFNPAITWFKETPENNVFVTVAAEENEDIKNEIKKTGTTYHLVHEESFEEGQSSFLQPVNTGTVYNGEQQYYLEDNVSIRDGHLVMTGKKEAHKHASYTSGKMDTKYTFAFQYGKVEVVAKSTATNGSFPAIWLLPESGKTYPEINIFEQIGEDANSYYAVNYWKDEIENKNAKKIEGIDTTVFHTYAMEWTKDVIIWSVDGKEVFRSTEGIPHEEMYIILNLAIGGEWAGDVIEESFPMEFTIDSIKVWQK